MQDPKQTRNQLDNPKINDQTNKQPSTAATAELNNSKAYFAGPALISAAIFFGLGNVAYRYGQGSSILIGAERCLVGAIIFLPVIWKTIHNGTLKKFITDKFAVITAIISGIAMIIFSAVFRTLTGPQIALVIATLPIFTMAFSRLFVQRKPIPIIPIVACVTAAIIAAVSGGLGEITTKRAVFIVLFVIAACLEMLMTERARQNHSSSLIVVMSLLAGAIIGYIAYYSNTDQPHISNSAYIAAAFVGIIHAIARLLRGHAILSLGSAVASSSSQITALVTALGGIILFNDQISILGACLSLIAAIASLFAVIQANSMAKNLIEKLDSNNSNLNTKESKLNLES